MLKTHKELIKELGSDVVIARQVVEGQLLRVNRGIYSDKPYASFVEIAMKRYPDAVVTLESAFFCQGLTDVIPDVLHLATDRAASRMADARICQHFVPAKILRVGATSISYNGAAIRTYDLERLVIEVVRMRTKIPFDLYKEVVNALRLRNAELYPAKIDDYLTPLFPRRGETGAGHCPSSSTNLFRPTVYDASEESPLQLAATVARGGDDAAARVRAIFLVWRRYMAMSM